MNVYACYQWHNSYHYLVLGCLHGTPLRENTKYLGRCTQLPIRTPTTLTIEDGLFVALRRAILKPKAREARKNAWILADIWRLVNERVSTRQDPARDQAHIRRLGRAINSILKEYRHRSTEEAGEEVELLLGSDPPSARKHGTV